MTLARLSTTLAAPFLLAACIAAPARAEPAALGGPKMLIHGNYCGPGNNAPLPPVDTLDAACARHDACTPYGGLPSRLCNLRLQQEAGIIARDPRIPEDERAMAGMIAAGATIIPSSPQAEPTMIGSRPAPPAPEWSAMTPLPDDADAE